MRKSSQKDKEKRILSTKCLLQAYCEFKNIKTLDKNNKTFRRLQMKIRLFSIATVMLGAFASPISTVFAHCQVPCGIYRFLLALD